MKSLINFGVLELFSDINFYITDVQGEFVNLEIEIEELPTLTEVKINGVKKGKAETLKKILNLQLAKSFPKVFLPITKNYIK